MPESTCSKCGQALKPGDKFCPKCGQAVSAKTDAREARLRKDHLIVLGILAIIAVIYIAYRFINPDEAAEVPPQHQHQQTMTPSMDVEAFRDQLPEDYSSLVSMGNQLMNREQFSLAAECYTRALEIKQTDPDVLVDLGTCQHNLGLPQEAIANFMRALQIDPTHQIAKFNLGIVYFTLDDTAQAIEWWDKLLAENPTGELKQRTEMLRQQALEN